MKPFEHQSKTIQYMIDPYTKKREPGHVLAFDMGLGKTATTLWFINKMIHINPHTCVLCILPVSVLDQWCLGS